MVGGGERVAPREIRVLGHPLALHVELAQKRLRLGVPALRRGLEIVLRLDRIGSYARRIVVPACAMEVEQGEGEIGGLKALGRGQAIPYRRERVAALLSGRGRGDLADHELGLRVAVLRLVDELAVGKGVVARGESGLAFGEIGMGGGAP